MTTRLNRRLGALDAFEKRRRYDRLTRATGLVLEATGLQLPLGATCIIERNNGNTISEIESEVVRFNEQKLLITAKTCRRVSNCCSVRNCWAGCWTAAGDRWMACRRLIPASARR